MTTSNGRAADSRRSSRSPAQWLLGLLIVLALVASILMVFTDRLSITGSLAVIAALWAAVIGAILVTKFRRQAESAEAKSRDLRLVYELQLEREIAARRQYELDVETTIRKEVTAESNEELSELKAQVLALRSSLEMLLGEPLPDQRVALSSEKMRELASGLNDESGTGRRAGASFGGDFTGDLGGVSSYGATYADDGLLAARDFAATAPTTDDGRHTGPVDPNEMTEVIPIVTDDPISGRIATAVPPEAVGAGDRPGDDEAPGAYVPNADVPDAGVSDAEIVDTDGPDATQAATPTAGSAGTGAVESPSLPFSGGFYLGNDAEESAPPTADTPTADTSPEVGAADQPLYTDDTPTDEWATGTPAGAPDAEAPDATDTDDDVEPPAFLSAAGRHENPPGGRAAESYGGGRRRRASDDDAESAHSAGLPVSELLNQLRSQAETSGGGRRRRNG
ncbi:DUF6779 domain-containing protein [Gordonia terrae]|uniref:DUF6779 domain-containing protein n=1 Tax=Gordonia terrae TaxID=2055 RepID=A0AAD0K9X9_9ACTN|nr:DUF6779 domain-containing protein [Gordonia terrae]ANY24891.1 hypothetical protein BCM27_20640 [Gordonia terrae]AWO85640.1 hypothetical protein DLJ61_20860 [Gordonia terrae]VTR12560.1 Uncharacterised protein [Clostridioides difficile]VTS60727.1 Uncharacterised protein [Gordonia terrae]